MKKILTAISLSFLLPAAAFADTPEVDIQTDNLKVKTGKDGVEVRTPGARVKVGKKRTTVRKSSRPKTLNITPAYKNLKTIKPIVCDGNKELTYNKVFIKAPKNGMVIKGNCEVTVTGSRIEANGYALRVSDNGELKVTNSTIIGTKGAVFVGDNGTVTAKKSRFRGSVKTDDNGEFEKEGGNTFN